MTGKRRGPDEAPKPYAHLDAPRQLLAWRQRMKLDQQGAANELGMDTATYNAFERGRKRPGIDFAMRIEIATKHRVPLTSWVDPRKTSPSRRSAA